MTTSTLERPVQSIEDNREIISNWKARATDKLTTRRETAHYILLRSLITKKQPTAQQTLDRLQAAFGPVTNKTKLVSGRFEYDTLENTLYSLCFSHGPLAASKELLEEAQNSALEVLSLLRQEIRGN